MIKNILKYGLFIAVFFYRCSNMELAGDLSDIPFPRTSGIIPLASNTQWVFSHASYDSSGNLVSQNQDLDLSIDRVYGYTDTGLILITQQNAMEKFQLYVYEYEWESLGEGLLISYRDQNVIPKGIYIHGEYEGQDTTLYPNPILWLKYPGSIGEKWQKIDPDTTDTIPTWYEITDTNTNFYIPTQQNNSSSPLEFLSCYVYKETRADTISYYYYNSNYGSVGFVQYVKGVMRRTFILKSYFTPSS